MTVLNCINWCEAYTSINSKYSTASQPLYSIEYMCLCEITDIHQ